VKMAIDTLVTKLQSLIGDAEFRSDYDQALDSPEHLLEIGKHNLREHEKIEAMDEERQERARNIVLYIVAGVLQKEAMEKCGKADSASIRQTLCDWYGQPENRVYCDKLVQSAKSSLADCDFTEDQRKIVNYCLDAVPLLMLETLMEETLHLRLLPCAEGPSISAILAEMMMERTA